MIADRWTHIQTRSSQYSAPLSQTTQNKPLAISLLAPRVPGFCQPARQENKCDHQLGRWGWRMGFLGKVWVSSHVIKETHEHTGRHTSPRTSRHTSDTVLTSTSVGCREFKRNAAFYKILVQTSGKLKQLRKTAGERRKKGEGWKFTVLFKRNLTSYFTKMSTWSLTYR